MGGGVVTVTTSPPPMEGGTSVRLNTEEKDPEREGVQGQGEGP